MDHKIQIVVEDMKSAETLCSIYGLKASDVEVSIHTEDKKFCLRPQEAYAEEVAEKNTLYHQVKSKMIGALSWNDVIG